MTTNLAFQIGTGPVMIAVSSGSPSRMQILEMLLLPYAIQMT